MPENQDAGSPHRELTFQSAIRDREPSSSRAHFREEQKWQKKGLSREEIVTEARQYIQQIRAVDALLETKPRNDAEIIRAKIDFEAGAGKVEKADFYYPLMVAFDALAYPHYPLFSNAGDLSNYLLNDYSGLRHRTGKYKEQSIPLAEPQVRMLDALTEVAGIPRQPGQNEIEIPFDALRERHEIWLRGTQRDWEERKRGEDEGISEKELSRRNKAVRDQMEKEWYDYTRPSLRAKTPAR